MVYSRLRANLTVAQQATSVGIDAQRTAASDGHPTANGAAANLENDNTAGRDAAQGCGVGANGTAVVTANTTGAIQ